MEKGLVHIYCGDGKGKTTAAAGLALRCAGAGGKVLMVQFLKDGTSGEIKAFRNVKSVNVLPATFDVKFSFKMTAEEKKAAAEYYSKRFETAAQMARYYDMFVADELLHAVNLGFVKLDDVLDFLNKRDFAAEIVITGREASQELLDAADYVTEMKKIKHPFDKGVKARKKVEY
ncbi:MAG: cob(I)yrinic acid a,c-diamide adenosyltransferase [Firmicutes bacterium]|nr:cob(I)yrinic acid a,c-diamide adenosyltransferase [Bacillota bacterium]